MPKIRITKEFTFEAAHALMGYDGPCRHVHGHSYTLAVTITGEPVSREGDPKLGMVLDFGDLKRIVKTHVVDPLDHALILHSSMKGTSADTEKEPFSNVVFVDYQPTSENMLADIAGRILRLLPPGVKLHHLLLRETATSYAEWYASDQA
jgi:6-pyruvoyltetrahydropterin/6-carboxytetrahydropterin synthase